MKLTKSLSQHIERNLLFYTYAQRINIHRIALFTEQCREVCVLMTQLCNMPVRILKTKTNINFYLENRLQLFS